MNASLVQPYDPAWPIQFEEITTFLKSGLCGIDCAFEHVGSTAIQGMLAKPIIDLNAVIPPGAFPSVKACLETLGYVHQGDLGIEGREAFDLADTAIRCRLPVHHLYVCEKGALELRRQLAFRDFMRAQPEWRERLNCLKQELCTKHRNDRQAYISGKADMVRRITELAMQSADPKAVSKGE